MTVVVIVAFPQRLFVPGPSPVAAACLTLIASTVNSQHSEREEGGTEGSFFDLEPLLNVGEPLVLNWSSSIRQHFLERLVGL